MIRSFLFIPGNQPNMIQNAYLYDTDAVIFDLEDAVLPSEKDNARHLIRSFLDDSVEKDKAKIFVRVNDVDSAFFAQDIEVIVTEHIEGIVLPKATISAIEKVNQSLSEIEETNSLTKQIKVIPIIEQALSILQVDDIASLPRVIGLLLGGEDLARDLEIRRTKEANELLYSRSRVVMAAAANQILSIDTPFTDVYDDPGFEMDTKNAASLGMKAKCAIHPRHIEFINQTFSPSQSDIANAKKILNARKEAEQSGKGSFSVDGKMVDKPIIERAIRTMEKAKAYHLVNEDEE